MKRKILLVDGYNMIAFWQETRQLFQKSELDAARNILLQKLSHYASFEGIEVICVFDAQYMPGVRQTYDEFNVQVVLPVRMRRQMTISSAWRQSLIRSSTRYPSRPVTYMNNGLSLLKEPFGYPRES